MPPQKKNRPQKILLVDSGYWTFYRINAIRTYFLHVIKSKDPEKYELAKQDDFDWFSLPGFAEKFEKMYWEGLSTIRRKLNIPPENVIFGLESNHLDMWRLDYIPKYKQQRKYASYIAPAFQYAYNTIIPNLVKNHNILPLQINRAEADDVLALCTKFIATKLPETPIVIITSDKDYLQLLNNYPLIQLINAKGDLMKIDESAKDIVSKSKLGDKSDNIPKVPAKGITKLFIHYINLNMMSFDYILEDICSEFNQKYNQQIERITQNVKNSYETTTATGKQSIKSYFS